MADALSTRLAAPNSIVGLPAISNFTLNQTTDQLEFIFQAREPATLTRLGFRQGTVTGTSPVFKVSLQGVDASGNPDGTIKGGASPASTTFTPVAGGNNTWQWKTLDNSYTCTRGESLAMVIAYSSGTIDVSNNCSFAESYSALSGNKYPYVIENDNGVRTRIATGNRPTFGYGSAGTAYGYPIHSATFFSNFNLGSTPDEWGLKFTLPAGWSDTFKVAGIRWIGDAPATVTARCQLYDTDGTTVLQTFTFDSDLANNRATDVPSKILFTETTLATLTCGNAYRIGLRPDTAGNWALGKITLAAAADWAAYDFGQQGIYTTRTDDGAWTDDGTTRPLMELVLEDLTEPAGAAGMLYIPNLEGM